MEDLEKYRREIDIYDKELVEIFERRMEVVLKVLSYKKDHGLPIFHRNREEEILRKAVESLHNKDFKQEIEELYIEMMRISRKLQSKNLFPYNIVLVGFMGSGKSSAGKVLSQLLEMPLFDTDTVIEEKMGMTIGGIFEEYGEDYFRELERNTVEEMSQKKNSIIACGGGVVLNGENVKDLKRNGKIILLEAEEETIYNRLMGDNTRPLLQNKINKDYIGKMLSHRRPYYEEAADLIIQTDHKNTDGIGQEIISKLLNTK